jgi:hypothetical protein
MDTKESGKREGTKASLFVFSCNLINETATGDHSVAV